MNSPRLISALCAFVLLNACAQTAHKKTADAIFPASYAGLLKDAEHIFDLPAEAQQKELANLSTKPQGDNQTRKAMFYTLSNSQYCTAPASAVTAMTESGDVRERKWEKERKALTKQLKESTEENLKLAQKAREEEMRADNLQQKLDELKNIETSLGNREQGIRR